jgi:hypothetical protein
MEVLSASVMFSSISKGAGSARLPCNGRSQPKNAPINRYKLLLARKGNKCVSEIPTHLEQQVSQNAGADHAGPTNAIHAVSLLAGCGRGLRVSIYTVKLAAGNRHTLLAPGYKTLGPRLIEQCVQLKSARQVRVGDEHLPESHRVGCKRLFGGLLIHLFVGDIDTAECCFQRGPEAAVAQRFT